MKADHILIVDDEHLVRWSISELLKRERYTVSEASSLAEARTIVRDESLDMIILDQRLPDGSGLDFLQELRTQGDSTCIIMLTADEHSQTAVRAMKLEAFDYLNKPVDHDHLFLVISKALELTLMKRQLARLRAEMDSRGQGELIGASVPMQRVFDFIRRAAAAGDSTILITGESGTGKELVARALHNLSPRRDAAMMSINCAGVQDSLIDSELFGHERGAFTDAREKKRGLFEVAGTGTLFLDEIGDISAAMQTKLLRVVEQKTFRRLGGTTDIALNARIITATNRDIRMSVKEGSFRSDLFFRLNVAAVAIPPLRERHEDVLLLAEHFLQHYNTVYQKQFKRLSDDTKELFLRYHWPGNVRELKHVIERAVLLDDGDAIFSHHVHLGHLDELPLPGKDFTAHPEGASTDESGRADIERALAKAANNQSLAARLLGISRDTLRYRMKKYAIRPVDPFAE